MEWINERTSRTSHAVEVSNFSRFRLINDYSLLMCASFPDFPF